MNIFLYLGVIGCVIAISSGQILFKLAANKMSLGQGLFQFNTLAILFLAFFIYGITSLVWVYLLQKIDIGKVYPLMALAFIFVPVGSVIFFGESFNARYLLGVFLIVSGILFTISF